MAHSRSQLLLHPVRMRILTALVGRQLTAGQLGELLDDIPQTTLYRHINKLAQADVLLVVEERPVRGTLEKVYTVNPGQASLGPDALAKASPEQLMTYFSNFTLSLLGDFSHYLAGAGDKPDLMKDAVGFHQIPLHLSRPELIELGQELNRVLFKYLANAPEAHRRRYNFSTIMMPGPEARPDGTEPVQ